MMDSYPDYYRILTDNIVTEKFDLTTAASLGDLKHVQLLLKDGKRNPNTTNASGWTPIMYAANHGHYNVIRLLIDYGADVNACEFANGRTGLMLAASNGHTRCVEVLVNHGKAALDIRDNAGNNAVFYATHFGHGSNKVMAKLLGIRDTSTPRKIIGNSNKPKIMVSHPSTEWPSLTPNSNSFEPFIRYAAINENGFKGTPTGDGYGAVGDGRVDRTPVGRSSSDQSLKRRLNLSAQKSPNDSWSPMSDSSIASNGSASNSPPLPESLEKLLARIGLDQYMKLFKDNGVDLYVFLTLTESDLKLLGVLGIGHRRKLCAAQTRFRESIEIRNTQESFFADWLLNERDQLKSELEMLKALNEQLMLKLNQGECQQS